MIWGVWDRDKGLYAPRAFYLSHSLYSIEPSLRVGKFAPIFLDVGFCGSKETIQYNGRCGKSESEETEFKSWFHNVWPCRNHTFM